jgi:hypothetical protein
MQDKFTPKEITGFSYNAGLFSKLLKTFRRNLLPLTSGYIKWNEHGSPKRYYCVQVCNTSYITQKNTIYIFTTMKTQAPLSNKLQILNTWLTTAILIFLLSDNSQNPSEFPSILLFQKFYYTLQQNENQRGQECEIIYRLLNRHKCIYQ